MDVRRAFRVGPCALPAARVRSAVPAVNPRKRGIAPARITHLDRRMNHGMWHAARGAAAVSPDLPRPQASGARSVQSIANCRVWRMALPIVASNVNRRL